jgi:hypothetical protein
LIIKLQLYLFYKNGNPQKVSRYVPPIPFKPNNQEQIITEQSVLRGGLHPFMR